MTPRYSAKNEYELKLKLAKKLETESTSKLNEKGIEPFKRIARYLSGQSLCIDRDIVIGHIDFEPITTFIAKNEPFTIISGTQPSSDLHLGHLALFKTLLEFQKLGASIIIPITNDESYVDGKNPDLQTGVERAYKSIIRDIIALGFEPDKTRIFVHTDYMDIYRVGMHFGNFIESKKVRGIFGTESTNTASKMFYRGSLQMSSILMAQLEEFGGPKHTLVPVGIDQVPYIYLTRDVAKKTGLIPPSGLVIEFLPGLTGPDTKMSKSKPDTAIYTNDTPEEVRQKIKKAYTGSVSSLEGHQKYGAIPEICPVFQLLRYYHKDDQFVDDIRHSYKKGTLRTSELKNIVAEYISNMLEEHRQKREQVDRNLVDRYLLKKKIRSI